MADTKASAFATATPVAADSIPGLQSGANKLFTLTGVKSAIRSYVDTFIDSNVTPAYIQGAFCAKMVQAAAGVTYSFSASGQNSDFYYQKSTNYRQTWGAPVLVKGTITCNLVGIWYDKWNPSDSGTLIHMTYADTVTGDVFYRTLDTASDTLGSEITVFNGASGTTGSSCISITKSLANLILIGYNIDGGTETGFAKSNDYPPTAFTAKTDFNESSSDQFLFFPGSMADTNDILAIFWDISANQITTKIYDDSANTWSEVAVSGATTMTGKLPTVCVPQFSATLRRTDGHILLVAWTNTDTLNADLMCWDIAGDGTAAAKTDVVTNSTDDQGMCAIIIDETTNDLYAAYCGVSAGSDTFATALTVNYKRSTDGGTTWGTETSLCATQRSILYLQCAPVTANADLAFSWGGAEISAASYSLRASAWGI